MIFAATFRTCVLHQLSWKRICWTRLAHDGSNAKHLVTSNLTSIICLFYVSSILQCSRKAILSWFARPPVMHLNDSPQSSGQVLFWTSFCILPILSRCLSIVVRWIDFSARPYSNLFFQGLKLRVTPCQTESQSRRCTWAGTQSPPSYGRFLRCLNHKVSRVSPSMFILSRQCLPQVSHRWNT